ncbi:Uncharacterized protein PBTT_01370 [Plasmodiophora brassicae]
MLLALLKSIYVGQTDTSFQKFCNIAAMFQQPGRESDKLQFVFNVLASGQKTLGIVDLQRLATKCSMANVPKFNDSDTIDSVEFTRLALENRRLRDMISRPVTRDNIS